MHSNNYRRISFAFLVTTLLLCSCSEKSDYSDELPVSDNPLQLVAQLASSGDLLTRSITDTTLGEGSKLAIRAWSEKDGGKETDAIWTQSSGTTTAAVVTANIQTDHVLYRECLNKRE